MPARTQHVTRVAAECARRVVDASPGRDVVGHASHHVRVARDLGQIDRRAKDVQCPGLGEEVVLEDVEQLAVQLRRKACRVVVPVENVEGRRRLAEQIVVDPEVPDEIVGSHPGENATDFLAFQHTLGHAVLFGHLYGLGRGKEPELRLGGIVQHRHHQRGRIDCLLTAACQMAEQRGDRHRTGACAMQVDIRVAGDVAHRLDRFDERGDIRVHVPVAVLLGGIAPAHGEHLKLVLHQILDDALVRSQIEDVELVDLRRHDQLRASVDVRGRWRVLNEFEDLVTKHDCTGRSAEIPADVERRLVDLGGHALVVQRIGQHVPQARSETRSARIHELPERRGIARQRVGRRECVGQERHHELRAFLARVIECRALDEAGECITPRLIALQRGAVQRLTAPCRIGEAFVALLRHGCFVAGHNRRQIAGERRGLIEQERGM
ncbi:hypothetical protein AWB81_08397 [Caballeronia arationis]|nr:hypothetical protein AWB81_08397 [Caballeronia arationis]